MKCCIFPRKKFHSNCNRNHNWILSWKYFYTIAWLLVLNCAFVLGFHLVPLLMKGSKFHSFPHVLSMSMSIEGVRGRQLIDHSIARGFLSREGGGKKKSDATTTTLAASPASCQFYTRQMSWLLLLFLLQLSTNFPHAPLGFPRRGNISPISS